MPDFDKTIPEIIASMRTCNMSQVRKQLEKLVKDLRPEDYDAVARFFLEASKQPVE